ncbi:hypothetical protein FAES_0267 [Fibrella aestuarina BUZ 2]|uniref:Secretion system C-terminal sorting domain-containing protein n=1 Tax=Fibrella aestuarina BUZ 2 TaxID=1166018 RepID=I0K2C8_9BACT|nr:T9SS type A sorting domain-containing protein [Fibrella aestuarina]CCG98281.1 hypothetical protein FAES_0267 [Fibrella aestuarina BUZ 2]
MTNYYTLRLLACLLLLTSPLLAQKKPASIKTRTTYEEFAFRQRQAKLDPIICYGLKENAFTSIGAPQGFGDGRARRAATSTFIVDYIGYPEDAKAAFQRAVDIWSTLISSPVPIRIKATWQPLGNGSDRFVTLGSARPATYFYSSDGAQKAQTFYPVALAEKIARRALNHPDSADIVANFNSENNWYRGLDAKPTAGTSDLVTVILHELGHGLGFTGGIFGDADTRSASVSPVVFDRFVETNTGAKLTDPTAFSTAALVYNQLIGRNLFLNGPVLQQKTGGKAKLYAPTTYSAGSTLYHLDEATYGQGNPNSLMTPNVNNAEAIHNPGPIVLAFFEDMEWKTTSLLHDAILDTESPSDIVVSARIISDTALGSAPPKIFYRKGYPTQLDNTFQGFDMTRVGTTNEYRYTIPAAQLTDRIAYFLRVQDVAGRVYSNPGRDVNDNQFFYSFVPGADRKAPTITHVPDQTVLFAAAADTIPIIAKIVDDRRLGTRFKQGVDTAYVEYQVNGVARPAVPLRYFNSDLVPDSTWVGLLTLPQNSLKAGDKLSYRIVARDLSAARNQAVSPATGFYEITIVGPQATVRSQYVNDFASTATATDFAGNNFRIETPTGFTSPSINSDHPYANGSDIFNESNFTYSLLAPIRVKANPDSAKIRFDEIVLVEPGESGATYLDQGFYDYVIVEASKDNGRTWLPLIDGYDASNRSEWLTAWNSRKSAVDPNTGEQNSTAVGTAALLKRREIGIYDKGLFRANDVILIRFRLFADQLAHGWGWQIDNLQIQVPVPVVLATEPTPVANFDVFPNPVSNTVRVTAELTQPATSGTLTLSSPTGQSVRQLSVAVRDGKQISEQMDLSQLPTGMYFLQLKAGDASQVKKIMVTH